MIQSSEFADDPLSDLLRLVDARPILSGGFCAGGDWALRFPAPAALKFFAIEKGQCWLKLENGGEVIRLCEGDAILLTRPRSFVMASDLSVAAVDAVEFFSDKPDRTAIIGDGRDCAQIGGHVWLDEHRAQLLTEALPDHIHITAKSPFSASITWLLSQMRSERALSLPGTSVVSRQITNLIFVQMLRAYLDGKEKLPPGMLRAFADQRLAPALLLLHEQPSKSWRLIELARAAGMSRTAFALHFKKVAGLTPFGYLARWRIQLAISELQDGNKTLAPIARKLGFSSESAFSNAFKREAGIAPAYYRQQARSLKRGG